MPDQLTAAGLEVSTQAEILAALVAEFQAIYGTDINVDSNSPDGQALNIYAQGGTDLRELLVAVYNSFAIDSAFGVYLDQRVALNGVARKPGTHTITNVTVTTSGALNLVGVDALVNDPTAVVFTLADNNGVPYQLLESVSIVSSGDHVLAFQASDVGIIEPIQNTITVQVTVVAGVTGVNNPDEATSIGTAEETDAQLKIRQAKLFFLASNGPADAIEAQILQNVPGVVDTFVYDNATDSPVDSVPAFSIWVIVDGGSDADIAQAIYVTKAPGSPMKGSVTYDITRPNGTTWTAKFDRGINEDLYIAFSTTPRSPGILFDDDAIKTALVQALVYKFNQPATIGDVVLAMAVIEPRAILSVVGVSSDGMSYVDILQPSDFQHKFLLTAAHIDITTL